MRASRTRPTRTRANRGVYSVMDFLYHRIAAIDRALFRAGVDPSVEKWSDIDRRLGFFRRQDSRLDGARKGAEWIVSISGRFSNPPKISSKPVWRNGKA